MQCAVVITFEIVDETYIDSCQGVSILVYLWIIGSSVVAYAGWQSVHIYLQPYKLQCSPYIKILFMVRPISLRSHFSNHRELAWLPFQKLLS